MPFTPPNGAPLELLPDGRVRVTAPTVWTGTSGDAVAIPAGTISDGASRPWFAAGVVERWGRITWPALVHDVLCDAANAWTAQGCPEATRPRFLGPDIDGALRAAARDIGAAAGERWLYWVAVRYGALFGSKGRRQRWASTLGPVLALTLPALLVALPAVLGSLAARALLVGCELAAWPWTRRAPVLRAPARRALASEAGRPRQLGQGAAQLWHAAQTLTPALDLHARPVVLDGGVTVTPIAPASGPIAVIHARRVAARQRDQGAAPWCGLFLAECWPGCVPAGGCRRNDVKEEPI